MRQRVKLTESQLRGMIQEAISKNLNPRKRKPTKLTESMLKGMIQEAVSGALNEIGDTPYGQYMLGRLSSRKYDPQNTISDYAKQQRDDIKADKAFFYGKSDQNVFQDRLDNRQNVDGIVGKIKDMTKGYRDELPSVKKQREEEERERERLHGKEINKQRRMKYRLPR